MTLRRWQIFFRAGDAILPEAVTLDVPAECFARDDARRDAAQARFTRLVLREGSRLNRVSESELSITYHREVTDLSLQQAIS